LGLCLCDGAHGRVQHPLDPFPLPQRLTSLGDLGRQDVPSGQTMPA
jgi:hypothetical protein